MSLKFKAFTQAVFTLILCTIAGITAAELIALIPASAIPWIAMAALLGLALHMLYGIILSRLEYQETINKRLDKLNEKA